jgi:hypothetical protein
MNSSVGGMRALSWRANRFSRVVNDWQRVKVRAVELGGAGLVGRRWRFTLALRWLSESGGVIGLQEGQRHFTCRVSVESVMSY